MKLNSDRPDAVYYFSNLVEESFERFIWRLYYESPTFYLGKEESSREPLYRDSLSHHRTSDVAYGGFAVMFTKS